MNNLAISIDRWHYRSVSPSTVLNFNSDLTNEEIDHISTEFNTSTSGPQNQGGLVSLTPGAMSEYRRSGMFLVDWSCKLFLMHASQTERGLVTAILKDDSDPSRRLVYADFLEENGRVADAEREMAKELLKLEYQNDPS